MERKQIEMCIDNEKREFSKVRRKNLKCLWYSSKLVTTKPSLQIPPIIFTERMASDVTFSNGHYGSAKNLAANIPTPKKYSCYKIGHEDGPPA